jgi:hypothetical protein
MGFFSLTELTIPATQMALLLTINTMALLFGRTKLALLVTYLFTLYWGYVLNREFLVEAASKNFANFTWVYFGFGLLVVFFSLAGFLRPARR